MPQFQPALHSQYQAQTNSNTNTNNYIDFNLMSEGLASRYNPAQSIQLQLQQQQQQQQQMQKRMEAAAAAAAQRQSNPGMSSVFPHQQHPYMQPVNHHHAHPHPAALTMHQHMQQQQHRNLGNLTTLSQTTTTTRTIINQVLPPPPLIHQPVLAPIQLQQILQPTAHSVRPMSPYHPLLAEQLQQQQSQANLSINIPRQVQQQQQLENSTTPTPPLTPSPSVANLAMPPALTRLIAPLPLPQPAPVAAAAAPIVARTCSRETAQPSEAQAIRDIQSIISKEMSLRARSSSCSDSSRDSDANKSLTLNSRIG
jgi:hypothetical protein